MPLCKFLNLGLSHLRAKLAGAARKAVNSTRHDLAGTKTATTPSTPTTEKYGDEKAEFPKQPSIQATTGPSTPFNTKTASAKTLASQRTTLTIAHSPTEAAFQIFCPERKPARSEASSRIGMTPLEQPWFSRRRSSLTRISALNLRMSDEVRSPRAPESRRREYIPPLLDDIPVTSDGIEMEMDEFTIQNAGSFEAGNEEPNDADDNASVLTVELVSFLIIHHANPSRFDPTAMSRNQTNPVASATSTEVITNLAGTEYNKEAPALAIPPRAKLRPTPLPASSVKVAKLTQPVPVQDHFCIVSDSPLSFQSMAEAWPDTPEGTMILLWPGTARSSISMVRPGTADSNRSEYQSVWW